MSIMNTKRHIIELLGAFAKMRDQFNLNAFLNIFKEYLEDKEKSEGTTDCFGNVTGSHRIFTEEYLQKRVLEITDANEKDFNKMNFQKMVSIDVDACAIGR